MDVAQLQRQLQNCYSHSIVYVDGVEVTDVRILVTDGSPREQVHLSIKEPASRLVEVLTELGVDRSAWDGDGVGPTDGRE